MENAHAAGMNARISANPWIAPQHKPETRAIFFLDTLAFNATVTVHVSISASKIGANTVTPNHDPKVASGSTGLSEATSNPRDHEWYEKFIFSNGGPEKFGPRKIVMQFCFCRNI
jgi:hypothetical protein